MALAKKEIGEKFIETLKERGFSIQEEFIYKNNKQKVLIKHEKCSTIFLCKISNFLFRKQGCNNKNCKLEKSRLTQLERYGVDNVSKLKETIEKRKQTCLERHGVDSFSKTDEFIEKSKKTSLERYGVDSFSKTDEFTEKHKQTCLERYGVDSFSKTDEFVEKSKKTSLERYGVDNVSKLTETAEKRKQTNIERYGVDNVAKIPEFLENNKKLCLEKYGVESYQLVPEIRNKIKKNNLIKYGVEYPQQSKEVKEKTSKTKRAAFYKKKISNFKELCEVEPLFKEEEYEGLHGIFYKFRCLVCDNYFEQRIDGTTSLPKCNKCFPTNRSVAEKQVCDFIKGFVEIEANKRFYDPENPRSWTELDILVPSKMIGFEFDGLYYHTETSGNKTKKYHVEKNEALKQRGIQTYHIWESEWRDKQQIVKSIIRSKLGFYSRRIFARKLQAKQIDNKKIVKKFLNENHIQGYTSSKFDYGLYEKDELICLLTLDASRFNKNYEYEIIRFCSLVDTTVVGGFSKLLSFFKKLMKPSSIITYADARYSVGNVYERNGFRFSHLSSPNYFYTNDYINLSSRQKFQKHKLKKIPNFIYDGELSEWENMVRNSYDRIWDVGNYAFIWRNS